MILISSVNVKAQHVLFSDYNGNLQTHYFTNNNYLLDSNSNMQTKKWHLIKYLGISSSYAFFNGGTASLTAVPIVLQLNRQLSKNWYAFANISAPSCFINFNPSFISSNSNNLHQNNNSLFGSSQFNIYPKASLGVMYINDEKTFSISGSISVERSNYYLTPYNNQSGTLKPAPFNSSRKVDMQ